MKAQGVWSDVLHMDFICICICLWWRQEMKTNIANKTNKTAKSKKNPDHSHHCNLENKGELFFEARFTMHLKENICCCRGAFFWDFGFFWETHHPYALAAALHMLDHINVCWLLSLCDVVVWVLLLLWRACCSSHCVFAMHNWKHCCCQLLCIASPSWVFYRIAMGSIQCFTMHMPLDFNGFCWFSIWNPWSHTWRFQALCNTHSYTYGAHAWACTC